MYFETTYFSRPIYDSQIRYFFKIFKFWHQYSFKENYNPSKSSFRRNDFQGISPETTFESTRYFTDFNPEKWNYSSLIFPTANTFSMEISNYKTLEYVEPTSFRTIIEYYWNLSEHFVSYRASTLTIISIIWT